MELSDHALLLLHRGVVLEVEEFVESVGGLENLGHQEVEERPQLVEVILRVTQRSEMDLQRRAGEEEAVFDGELAQDGGELAVLVLHAMRLVDDDVATREPLHAHAPPGNATERSLLDDCRLVGGDQDVPLATLLAAQLLHQRDTRLLVAVEPEALERGAEARHLVHPVAERGLGDEDQMGTSSDEARREGALVVHVLLQEPEEGDGFQRLAETWV